MAWLKVSSRDLDGGDKLVGPLHGTVVTLVVIGLQEAGNGCFADMGAGKFHSELFPDGFVDLANLPKGWHHVKAKAVVKKAPPLSSSKRGGKRNTSPKPKSK